MMCALVQTQVISLNSFALRSQDDAYTLAFYLLGDDAAAARVTQSAFQSVFGHLSRQGSVSEDRFRLEVLRWILKVCRGDRPALTTRGLDDDLIPQLLMLPMAERSAVVLVDVLNLNYRVAALVLGCSEKELAKRLGRARLLLSRAAEMTY